MSLTAGFDSATQGAATGGIFGAVLGGITGLFSDAANHTSHVQGHAQAYQVIAPAAAAGSLQAMRKLLWGMGAAPNGDYDEIKPMITAAWNQVAASNPALAAQARQAGGLSNNTYPLAQALTDAQAYLGGSGTNFGTSLGAGSVPLGNPASLAVVPIVGQPRYDPQYGGTAQLGAPARVNTVLANVESGDPMTYLVIAGLAAAGYYIYQRGGR